MPVPPVYRRDQRHSPKRASKWGIGDACGLDPNGDAQSFLTHFVVVGLDDDQRYVVETYRPLANGEIVPILSSGTKAKGRRKARGAILIAKAVTKTRPAGDQIIIATGVKRRRSGVKNWGWLSLGMFADRRQRG